ncbi:hypothetical protein Vretimale_17234, partial [Volvox reticuliferus]
QEAGEAGDVDVSMALAQQAQEMPAQHDRLHRNLTAPERTMSVCDICGVFINSTDNDQRRQVRSSTQPTPSMLAAQVSMDWLGHARPHGLRVAGPCILYRERATKQAF